MIITDYTMRFLRPEAAFFDKKTLNVLLRFYIEPIKEIAKAEGLMISEVNDIINNYLKPEFITVESKMNLETGGLFRDEVMGKISNREDQKFYPGDYVSWYVNGPEGKIYREGMIIKEVAPGEFPISFGRINNYHIEQCDIDFKASKTRKVHSYLVKSDNLRSRKKLKIYWPYTKDLKFINK